MTMTTTTFDGSARERIIQLLDTLERFPAWILELMFRVGVSAVFFKSGLTKIANWDITVQLFADEYRVPVLPPELAAYLGTAAELICPVLITFGIAARLGAAGLLGMTMVIQTFVYPENWAEHLLWASALAYVLTRGPGLVSIDALVSRGFLGRR